MKKTCCTKEQETPFCAFCGKCLCVSPLDWLEKYLVAAIVICRKGIAGAEEALRERDVTPANANVIEQDKVLIEKRKERLGERIEALEALRELRSKVVENDT